MHAVCQQVPVRGMHRVPSPGVCASRLRLVYREARARPAGEAVPAAAPHDAAVGVEEEPPPALASVEALRCQAWARLLRKVLEVAPRICPRCKTVEMAIVAWITDRDVVDRILRHRRERDLASVFETPPARAPAAAQAEGAGPPASRRGRSSSEAASRTRGRHGGTGFRWRSAQARFPVGRGV